MPLGLVRAAGNEEWVEGTQEQGRPRHRGEGGGCAGHAGSGRLCRQEVWRDEEGNTGADVACLDASVPAWLIRQGTQVQNSMNAHCPCPTMGKNGRAARGCGRFWGKGIPG